MSDELELQPEPEVKIEPEVVEVKTPKAKKPKVEDERAAKIEKAAQELIKLYEKSHNIKSIDDYRYPGLKDLVLALK